MSRVRCANDNHGRAIVTVRFCCTCGEVVNRAIRAKGCSELGHARMRRDRIVYCFDCGERVARAGPGR